MESTIFLHPRNARERLMQESGSRPLRIQRFQWFEDGDLAVGAAPSELPNASEMRLDLTPSVAFLYEADLNRIS